MISTNTIPSKAFSVPVRKLMGPGPSEVYPQVLKALSQPSVGHLDPEFIRMMDEVKDMTRQAFFTENELTIVVSAPGSAGMETCFVNLVEPGDKVIVCINGVFGGRMKEIASRCGGEVLTVEDEWGKPVDPNKLEAALKANPDTKIVAFVHAETSTGALSDAALLSKIAKQYGCLVIADTVTSLGGNELRVDRWQLDAVYSGSQKCLSCVPGLSPVTFSPLAVKKLKNRKTPVLSWFLDLNLIMSYWDGGSKRAYHHTAPVNSLYAMHEALRLLLIEGLENSWNRHFQNHLLLKSGLEELGFNFLVEESARLPQLNSVLIPAGLDEAALRLSLINDFNLEVGAGLGALAGKIWRIGLMGYGSSKENIVYCLSALKET